MSAAAGAAGAATAVPQTIQGVLGNVFLAAGGTVALVLGCLTVSALMLIWMERKVSARMQGRLGPTEVGPFGLLQTIADMGKLVSKQLMSPVDVDRTFYYAAPILVFMPVIAACALIPWSKQYVLSNYDISLILLMTFGGVSVIAIFAAGWGSNNKYALLGAVRAIAQNISYEIPVLLSVLPIVMMTRSASLYEIAGAQPTVPFIVMQPLAALIYLIAVTAETNRAPFDIAEAESELVGGFHTEYAGMRFGMFFFAEYSNMVILSAVGAILFLGGWSGPFLPGTVWLLLKTYFLIMLMMIFRWTFPRLRFDQLLSFAWLILVPLATVNLLLTALVLRLK